MKKMLLTSIFIFILIPFFGIGEISHATQPLPPYTGKIVLEPDNELVPTKPIEMKFYFSQVVNCDEVKFTITTWGGLIYNGQAENILKLEKTGDIIQGTEERAATLFFEIIIPDQDTSGLIIEADFCGYGNPIYYSFVTTADTVEIVDDILKNYVPLKSYTQEQWDSISVINAINFDSLKNDKDISSEGSERSYISSKEDILRRKKRILELKPLTEEDRQWLWIGDSVYVRDRGETKFRTVPKLPMDSIKAKHERDLTYLREHPPDNIYDYILDLREPVKYNYAKEIVDSLIPTDSIGFYRVLTLRPKLIKLTKFGIQSWPTRNWPPKQLKSKNLNDEKNNEMNIETDSLGKSFNMNKTPDDILFSDDFEFSWPGQWYTTDDNAYSGYDYWGRIISSAYVYSGSYSIWCMGNEYDYVTHYDNNMYALCYNTSAINTEDYSNVKLSFKLRYDVEDGFDFFKFYVSADGRFWVMFDSLTGTSYDWINKEYSIYDDPLYIMFLFSSDDIFNNYMGVLIDEVQVTGTNDDLPNLAYDWPIDWNYPIVVSPVPGTHTSGQLYGGQPAYIDLAITNNGYGNVNGTFYTALYIDYDFVTSWSKNGLSVNESKEWLDYQRTLSTGAHIMQIVVDFTDLIDEENEWDNEFDVLYWWDDPTITYTGRILCWDIKPPANPLPAREVKVELYDKQGASSRLLDETETSTDGYFSFPPITNIDTDASKLDIFFRIIADNDICRVINNDLFVFQYQTAVGYEHNNGVFDTIITIPEDAGGPFYVANVIKEASDKWVWSTIPTTRVILDNNIGTYYWQENSTIYVNTGSTGLHPDTYDRDVLIHEFAHRIQHAASFLDSVGVTEAHYWDNKVALELAATEAFADFWSSYVRNDKFYKSYIDNVYSSYFKLNLENGEYTNQQGVTNISSNNYGDSCEGAVSCILWDIYDNNNDDYSWWTGTAGQGYQDGIQDTLSDDISNIINAFVSKEINGHHPDNIQEFWAA